jgi:hypothetical protein
MLEASLSAVTASRFLPSLGSGSTPFVILHAHPPPLHNTRFLVPEFEESPDLGEKGRLRPNLHRGHGLDALGRARFPVVS